MNDLISIIVPVYKVAPYLPKCLESLINQTYKNIEILLIDDGSPDESGDICEKYAESDHRIQVFHINNQGISATRNFAIDRARGKYLMFVDSDDWVEPDYCRIPYETAAANDADLVVFPYSTITDDGVTETLSIEKDGRISKREAIDLLFFSRIGCVIWNKLYRKKVFAGIRFPEDTYYEDVGTTHKLIISSDKIFAVNNALYNYRIERPGSVTSCSDRKHLQDKTAMYRRRSEDLRAIGYPDEIIETQEVEAALTYLIYFRNNKDAPDYQWCYDTLKKTAVLNSPNNTMQRKRQLLLRLFKFSPTLFDLLCTLSGKKIK